MTLRSLGLASEHLAMTGISTFEAHPDRIVQRTPSEPTYWHGNKTIFLGPTDPLAALAQFEADHPAARHRCMVWDVPGPDAATLSAALGPLGFECAHGAPEAHHLEQQLRRIARTHVAEFVDGQAVEPPREREQRDRECLGDEAGAGAGAVDRCAAFGAGPLDQRA